MLTRNEFEALYNHHFDDLAAFLHSYSADKAQLKDWIHDVFIKIWEARDQIEFDHPAFKSYLLTTARNHALKQLHTEKRYECWLEQNLIRLTKVPTPEISIKKTRNFSGPYRNALSKIPSRPRQAYLLSRENGLTYREIAEVMDISVKTVEAHISKALQILREELIDYSRTNFPSEI